MTCPRAVAACERPGRPRIGFMSCIPDVAGKKAEGLVDPDPVDRLPVLGDEPVFDAEEVESREVRRAAAGGDRAVPHASGREPVVLGDDVRLKRPPAGHRPAVDGYRAGKGGPAVRSPARVLDVAVGDDVGVILAARRDQAIVKATHDGARFLARDGTAFRSAELGAPFTRTPMFSCTSRCSPEKAR